MFTEQRKHYLRLWGEAGCSGDRDNGMYVARNNNDVSYEEAWGKKERKKNYKTFPQFLYKWQAFLPVMTWRWAMVLRRVPPGGWTMARHRMAWWRLVACRGRSSVMKGGRRIATSGSGAGSRTGAGTRPIPVWGAPLLTDADVRSLALM